MHVYACMCVWVHVYACVCRVCASRHVCVFKCVCMHVSVSYFCIFQQQWKVKKITLKSKLNPEGERSTHWKSTYPNTNKWKDTLCSQIGRINIVYTLQNDLQIQCNCYENAGHFFTKIFWNYKIPPKKAILIKKNIVWSFIFPVFKLHYKSIVIKAMLVVQKRHTDRQTK